MISVHALTCGETGLPWVGKTLEASVASSNRDVSKVNSLMKEVANCFLDTQLVRNVEYGSNRSHSSPYEFIVY